MNLKINIIHKKLFLIIFMVSFLVGILFTNLFGKAYILGVGVVGEYFLLHFRYTQINYNSLFAFVFQRRIKLFLLVVILGITNLRNLVVFCLFIWLGFSSGVLLSVAIIKFGIKGILICLGATLPQFLIYIPLIIIGADKMLDNKMSKMSNRLTWKKQKWPQYCLFILIGILIMTLGILAESYINPIILKKILNFINLSG